MDEDVCADGLLVPFPTLPLKEETIPGCCLKGPGVSDEYESRTQNLVQWVRVPAVSVD